MHLIIKTAVYLACLIYLLTHFKSIAQNHQLYAVESLPLEVCESRTVSLSFPASVKAVDRGSAELLAKKAPATDNVILVKAARKNIQPTSLTVITADGDLHVFEVRYQEQPSALGLQLISKQGQPPAARISNTIDQNQIRDGINLALGKDPNLNRKQEASGFSATIDGLYVRDAVMYLRLSLENRSMIDYDLETLRLFTTDKRRIKRSASQQEELRMIGISAETRQVKASEQKTLVVAIPKLTLPKNKLLSLLITEQNGARNLSISLKHKHLNRITSL